MSTCTWPVSYAACSGGTATDVPPEPLASMKADQRTLFESMASDMLRAWTGSRFGVCEVAVRPCSSSCAGARRWISTFWGRGPYPWQGRVAAGPWTPALIAGEWYNVGCACGSAACSCSTTGPTAIRLPGPVVDVTSVTVDGVVVPPEAYSLEYGAVLVRRDGQSWPACQDLLAPATAADTFEVVYTRGVAVPQGGQVATGILALELAKAACGDKSCQLPQRVQTVTRQGVTIGMAIDNFEDLKDGHTGVWLVDSWVASVKGAPSAMAGVRSPDFRSPRPMAQSR